MGVILRQGSKQSIINYFGAVLGAISSLLIYPLNKEFYGIAVLILSTSEILIPIASLGFNSISVRFFPEFKAKKIEHYLLPLLVAVCISCFLVFFSITEVLLFLFPSISNEFVEIFDIRYYIWTVATIQLLIGVFSSYASNFKRIVIPAILVNILQKIALPAIIFLAHFMAEDKYFVMHGMIFYGTLSLLSLVVYFQKVRENILFQEEGSFTKLKFGIRFMKAELIKKMGAFSIFNAFTILGSKLALRIDHLMITSILSLSKTGSYGITQFMGNAIEIPAKAIFAIANPILSTALEKNDIKTVAEIYKKSSTNLVLVGYLAFSLIWFNLETMFTLTPNLLEMWPEANYVFLFIALGKLIDMLTSVNTQIIMHSKYYKFNFYSLLILAAINIVLNLYLIPVYGIVGAALASFIAMVLINGVRLFFVKTKFNLIPFSINTLKVFAIILIVFLIGSILPNLDIKLLSVAFRVITITTIFSCLVYFSKVSEDINTIIDNIVLKYFNRK